MYNFDPYNVLLSIATNIPVLLMTAFVLQGRIWTNGGVFPHSYLMVMLPYLSPSLKEPRPL